MREIRSWLALQVLAACGVIACHGIPDEPKAATAKGVTDIAILSADIVADGSLYTVKIAVDTIPRPADGKVALTTSVGAFPGSVAATTVAINDSGFAYVAIRAPTEAAVAIIAATAASVTRYKEFSFRAAAPDQVELKVSGFSVPANAGSITLSAQLSRRTGTPSPGTLVTFQADRVGENTGVFGSFSPQSVTSTSTTVASSFSPGFTTYRGPVVIRVLAKRDAITRIDSVIVQVVAPPAATSSS